MLCIPDSLDSRSDTAASRGASQPEPVAKRKDDGSSDSRSSHSATETKRSHQVLDVLKAFNLRNLKTVKDVALVGVDGDPIDDKTYLMERIIQLVTDLPISSRTSATLTNAFLNQLWTDLQHPPQSYLGSDFIFRKADGSGNNILWPHLGAVGQPYARTVRPVHMQPVARPDPGVIFDSLLVRKGFKPHPNKISSVLFYVATIIIHDIFHTSHEDYNISETSSYLDLAPLYGSSQEQQDSVRTRQGGKLKPDCFADIRILGFPLGVGVLLIMFNRFHNHVADNLALIDENGRFSKILNPHGQSHSRDPRVAYDEALFQTARLITTGLYINIVLKDYVRTILNLNRVDSEWNLDPRSEEGNALFGHKIPEATGNSVSAEFNLVYRWHSCVSERDEEWTKETFQKLFGNNEPLNMRAFLSALNDWAKSLSTDPLKRDFAGLVRQANNKYPDEGLAAIWTASVADVAGSYGAGHVPEILKNVEILGMVQSRTWNLASLNEFRAYFKLKPHEKFEDINPDPTVAAQLRRLYGHPDNVEIYPGIIVEAAKVPKKPGSGLCTNYTTSRAILSDAVALVRGDRFYTVDYTPANLTNWGFAEANYDLSINYGCVFYKLVLNALPNSYRQDSIYAHYPLVIPAENKTILSELKKANLYNFEPPTGVSSPVIIRSVETCMTVANDRTAYQSNWNPEVFVPGRGLGNPKDQAPILAQKLLEMEGLPTTITAFYKDNIANLVKSEAYQLAGSWQVDMIQDVFNVTHARFIASLLLLPLKTDNTSLGQYNELDIISLLSVLYTSASFEQVAARRFAVTVKREKAVRKLAELIQSEVDHMAKSQSTVHTHSTSKLRTSAMQAVQAASKSGLSPTQIVWNEILPLAARLFVVQSAVFADALDYFFGQGQTQLQEVQQLQRPDTTSSPEKLQSVVRDVIRHQPSRPFFRKAVTSQAITDGKHQIQISPGQQVICDMVSDTSLPEP